MFKLTKEEEGPEEWTYGSVPGGRFGSAWQDGTVHMMGDKNHPSKVAHKNTYNQAIRTLKAYLKGHRP